MKPKDLLKQYKKKHPKTFSKLEKRWDMKMMGEVTKFTFNILKDINPKIKVKKDDWIIDGPEVEEKVWKLLKKVRRITLLQTKDKPNE